MANPTTNYGFVLPTSTDLVTDLPADFDVALQGVDTRLKALQPGTTLGDIVYSSATANTNTRLGIGSTSQVLTVSGGVPVWATAGSGGFNLVKKVDFTTSSSIDCSDAFSATYVNYMVIANYVGTTDDDLNYRYRVAGADNTSANYNRSTIDVNAGAFSGGQGTGLTLGRIGPTAASGSRMSSTGFFIAPFLAQTKHSQMRTSVVTNTIKQNFVDIGFNAATSFTGLTIYPGSGTVTGTISIYGLTNS